MLVWKLSLEGHGFTDEALLFIDESLEDLIELILHGIDVIGVANLRLRSCLLVIILACARNEVGLPVLGL